MKALWSSVLDWYIDLTNVFAFPLEKGPCRFFKEVKLFSAGLSTQQTQHSVWCWQHRWQEMVSFLSKQLRTIAFVTSRKITLCLWLLFHPLRGGGWLNQGRKYADFVYLWNFTHITFDFWLLPSLFGAVVSQVRTEKKSVLFIFSL